MTRFADIEHVPCWLVTERERERERETETETEKERVQRTLILYDCEAT